MKSILAILIAATIGASAAESGWFDSYGLNWSMEPGSFATNRCADASGHYAASIASNLMPAAIGYTNAGNGHVCANVSGIYTDDFTIAVWFKTTSTSNQSFIGTNLGSPGVYIDLHVTTQLAFSVRNATNTSSDKATTNVPSLAAIWDGRWHLVAGRYNTRLIQLELYWDGILVATEPITSRSAGLKDTSTAPLYFGAVNRTASSAAPIRQVWGTIGPGAEWLVPTASNRIFRMWADNVGRINSL